MFQTYNFPVALERYSFRFPALMWTGLPSLGSSRVPTSGTIFPRYGTCHTDKLASQSGPPWHSVAKFYCHHPSPLLKYIFKIHLQICQIHPHLYNLFKFHCMYNQTLFMQQRLVIGIAHKVIIGSYYSD